MSEAQVVHNREHRVFEIVEGGQVAGTAEYLPAEGAMAITHVVVRPEFGGRGYGSRLAKAALDEARDSGLDVLPFCWFVREQLKQHPEYLELVPKDQRRRFGLAA
jgi:predicted GNAT family acetyltransferase